jgi:hypothetical protein
MINILDIRRQKFILNDVSETGLCLHLEDPDDVQNVVLNKS